MTQKCVNMIMGASHLWGVSGDSIIMKPEVRTPDSAGRIVIGREYAQEQFSVEPQPNGEIILRPVVVMAKSEAWLFQNQEALSMVRRGLEQSAAGRLVDMGSFAEFDSDGEDEDEETND